MSADSLLSRMKRLGAALETTVKCARPPGRLAARLPQARRHKQNAAYLQSARKFFLPL